MSNADPAVEHLRNRWRRPDAWRFAAPGSPQAVRPGWLDPRARPHDRVAEAKARAEHEAFERELRKLRCDFAWLKFEIALRRYLQRKYSPDQPRVPAGSGRESGRWTDGRGGAAGSAASGATGSEGNELTGEGSGVSESVARSRIAARHGERSIPPRRPPATGEHCK